jgi:hypothetical protein
MRQYLSDNFYDLQRAIESALQTKDDPRPIHFVISSNFRNFVAEPKSAADCVVAQSERIDQ